VLGETQFAEQLNPVRCARVIHPEMRAPGDVPENKDGRELSSLGSFECAAQNAHYVLLILRGRRHYS
jgi:hypothetical protein